MLAVLAEFWEHLKPRTVHDPDLEQVLDPDTDIDWRETVGLLGRALRYIGPFWHRFALKTVFAIFSLLPSYLFPWTLSVIIDHVIRAEPVDDTTAQYPSFLDPIMALAVGMPPFEILFWTIVFSLILVALVGGFQSGSGAGNDNTNVTMPSGYDTAVIQENIANTAYSSAGGLYGLIEFRWQLRLSQALNHHYRSQIYQKIKSFPMALLDNQRIGDTIYRVVYDTPAITGICYQFTVSIIVAFVNIALIGYTFATTFPKLDLLLWIAVLQAPVQLLIILPFARLMRNRQHMSRVAGSATTATMEEGMNNMLAVQALGGEKRQLELFSQRSLESFKRYRGIMGANELIDIIQIATKLAFDILVLWIVIPAVIDGYISAGNVVAVMFYFGWLGGAIGGLGRIWINMQDNAVGVRRVFALLDLKGEDDSGETMPAIREGVRFENVDFEYPDGRRALHDINLEARVGQVVAIVGPTGAGKTTLAYMIPRYHSPTRGRVLIDGIDIETVSHSSLRSQISYVFQETHLFTGTIADNIRYGNPEASIDAMREAARIAGADAFIDAMPDGYDTVVGRGGSTLSVGQKQRLSLARALIMDTPILILDEPTSALDPETEARLVATLEAAAESKLVVVVAHRLSTIRNADQIVLLQRGEIVERGRHDELMASNGAYAEFVEHQLGNGQNG